jgi:hypothetical protein
VIKLDARYVPEAIGVSSTASMLGQQPEAGLNTICGWCMPTQVWSDSKRTRTS